jgi:hypothetical protein
MTHFIIPYKIPRNPVFGWELMFCLRGIEKYYKSDYNITIIGECPDYIDQNQLIFLQNDQSSKDLKEICCKINDHYLIASEFYEDFVVIHDDMYMVNECNYDNFKNPKYIETDINYTFSKDESKILTVFQKKLRNTWKVLKDRGSQCNKNYIAHFPFLVNSEKLKILNEEFDLRRNNHPFENLYYNYFEIEGEPLLNLKSGHYFPEDHQINNKAKILNHDEKGYIYQPWIITLLYKLFPKPSRFEKSNYV